jgi:hypothetical protein
MGALRWVVRKGLTPWEIAQGVQVRNQTDCWASPPPPASAGGELNQTSWRKRTARPA